MSWDWALLLLLLHGTLLAVLIAALVYHFRTLPRRETLLVVGLAFFALLGEGGSLGLCIEEGAGLRSCLFQGNLWFILIILVALVSLNIRAYQLGVDQGREEADAARGEFKPPG